MLGIMSLPRIAAVVLSMGDRPDELSRALNTLLAQEGVTLDVVVVGNGWVPSGLPADVRSIALTENVGIPAGRNIGAAATEGDYLFFYDDDAALPARDALARLCEVFEDPEVAVVQPRPADPAGRPAPRRWVPRLRTGHGGRGGDIVVFWEGVCCIRRTAFEAVGGWPGHFWYGHEGIDLALRLIDAGWRLVYACTIEVTHPATPVTRHTVFFRMNARNRVWVARRNLPWPIVPVYLASWVVLTGLRFRQLHALRTWADGFIEGWRTAPGRRHPISWRTVGRLTLSGRPPII